MRRWAGIRINIMNNPLNSRWWHHGCYFLENPAIVQVACSDIVHNPWPWGGTRTTEEIQS